jgi:hypothetical protein
MKRKHSHSFFLVLAVLVLIFVTALSCYLYYMIGISVSHAADARNLVSADAANKSREQNFVELYQSTSEKWLRLSNFFIPADKVVTFIESLEALGPQSGSKLTLSAIDADNLESAVPGTQGKVHARLSSTGSWSSVMRLLSLAEVLPYKITIGNVSLQSAGGDVSSLSVGAAKGSGAGGGHSWSISFDIQGVQIATVTRSSTTSSPIH